MMARGEGDDHAGLDDLVAGHRHHTVDHPTPKKSP